MVSAETEITTFGRSLSQKFLSHARSTSVALDDLKQSSIDTYKMWVSAGKPRQGILFDFMKDAKYKYKLAVRDAIHVHENTFYDDLYDHLLATICQISGKLRLARRVRISFL